MNCVVCGEKAELRTGYIYYEDGKQVTGAYFCPAHLDLVGLEIATPVFQNQKALARFRQEHPMLYGRTVKGKRIIFMEETKK